MLKFPSSFCVFSVAGLVLLSGCSSPPTEATTADETIEEVVELETCAGTEVAGDVIAGAPMSNSAGEYCSVIIDPNSPAMTYDPSKTAPELYALGYTDEQLEHLQQHTVTRVVEAQVDNPAAALPREEVTSWVLENAHTYFLDSMVTHLLDEEENDNGLNSSDIILLSSEVLPPLVMDGRPRVAQVTIEIDSIELRTLSKNDKALGMTWTEDVGIVLRTTTSYRVDPDVDAYRQWRISSFEEAARNEGASDSFVAEVVEDEISSVVWTQPVYRDVDELRRIGYRKVDVQSESPDFRITSQQTELEAGGYWNVRN